MTGILGLVGFLEMIAGIGIMLAAPSVLQEIAGLVAFGFGVLTMAVVHGVHTIQTVWKKVEKASATRHAAAEAP